MDQNAPAPLLVSLVAAYIGDGYLYGASTHPDADSVRYWPSLYLDGEPFALVRLDGVPADVAAHLEEQGTSGQHYADGYEAANAAAPYAGAELYRSDDYAG